MPSVRTQIYLTPEMRARIDAVMQREHKSLAEVVREAIDAYLDERRPDPEAALESTFGAIPDLCVPSRDEWERG